MKMKKNLVKVLLACALMAPVMVSCSDDDKIAPVYEIAVNPILPSGYVIDSQKIIFTEINTNVVTPVEDINNLRLAAGTYNIEATAVVSSNDDATTKNMRAIAQNVVITETTRSVTLDWFFYNPDNSLVISEIYLGSLNATGKGLLYDSHISISVS